MGIFSGKGKLQRTGFFIVLIVVLLVVLYRLSPENTGWIQDTDELAEYRRKMETQGYLTEEDFDRIEKIHDEQFDHLMKNSK